MQPPAGAVVGDEPVEQARRVDDQERRRRRHHQHADVGGAVAAREHPSVPVIGVPARSSRSTHELDLGRVVQRRGVDRAVGERRGPRGLAIGAEGAPEAAVGAVGDDREAPPAPRSSCRRRGPVGRRGRSRVRRSAPSPRGRGARWRRRRRRVRRASRRVVPAVPRARGRVAPRGPASATPSSPTVS